MENTKQVAAEKLMSMLETCNPSETQKLEVYDEIFKPQFEMFKDSNRAKIKGLEERDFYILGETLAKQQMMQLQEGNSLANLGTLPTISLDVITAVFGNSVIPYFASEQVIDEVQGMVYFENVYATSSRGNIEVDDVLSRATGVPDKYPQGFAGEMVYGEELGTTTATNEFEVKVDYAPIRPQYVTVKLNDLVATDDGKGNLIGNGIFGTVNYTTGDITVKLAANAEADQKIIADYATNFEMGELPSINNKLDNKLIKANVYALQTDTSIINAYVMQKRFNMDMKLRAVNLLQENILNEVTNDILAKIISAVELNNVPLTQFNMTLPQGVSQQAHYNSVNYTFEVISNKMATASGKGKLSCIIASPKVCAFLASLNNFKVIGEISAFATVYGVWNNQTVVIRAPQLDKMPTYQDRAIVLYKGDSPYDAAAVYAPFMPLIGTNDIPVSSNLIQRRSAVASMAATDVLVPRYLQQFGIANSPYYA